MEAALSVQSTLSNSRIFCGWFVVAAAFAVTFVGFGCAYTFGAFLDSLQRDFSASRGSVSLVFSLAGFLYFGLGIISGPLADRYGSRRLALAGVAANISHHRHHDPDASGWPEPDPPLWLLSPTIATELTIH